MVWIACCGLLRPWQASLRRHASALEKLRRHVGIHREQALGGAGILDEENRLPSGTNEGFLIKLLA